MKQQQCAGALEESQIVLDLGQAIVVCVCIQAGSSSTVRAARRLIRSIRKIRGQIVWISLLLDPS